MMRSMKYDAARDVTSPAALLRGTSNRAFSEIREGAVDLGTFPTTPVEDMTQDDGRILDTLSRVISDTQECPSYDYSSLVPKESFLCRPFRPWSDLAALIPGVHTPGSGCFDPSGLGRRSENAIGTCGNAARQLISFLLILCFASIAAAESGGNLTIGSQTVAMDRPPVVADSAWFDSEANEIVPINVKDQRTDASNRESRWSSKPKPVVTGGGAGGSNWNLFGDFSWWNLFGWMLLILLMGGLAAALGWIFTQTDFDFRQQPVDQTLIQNDKMDKRTLQRIKELPAELRTTENNPRGEAERLAQQGEYSSAIIFLFGHQLLLLDRVHWLRLSRGKTNNQYVRETRQHSISSGKQLRATANAFERTFFGRHEIGEQEFKALWQANLEMEREVASSQEKAA